MDQLSELKRLLFAQEQQSIERLRERIEAPVTRAHDVAEVLADSFRLNEQNDARLVASMRSSVNQCINESVRADPTSFADALFPVIGPAIRKAVAESISGLVERINTALEHSLSAKGIRWRLESARTGVPVSEIVLRDTLIYRVEEAFVIQADTGLLLAHAALEEIATKDSDAVSAMLSAIHDFVRDSFRSVEQADLDTINVGGQAVWIFYGPLAMIAGVIRGHPPPDLRETFHEVNERVHADFAEYLAATAAEDEADSFGKVSLLLRPILARQSMRGEAVGAKSSLKPFAIAAGIVGIALLSMLFVHHNQSAKREQLLTTLRDIAGVEILAAEQRRGKFHIRALRDPMTDIPPELVKAHGFDANAVVFDFAPYQSLDPQIVEARLRAILDPPATVELNLSNDVLFVSGSAPQTWYDLAKFVPLGVAGIRKIDLSRFTVSEQERLDLARHVLTVPDTVDIELVGSRLIGRGVADYHWLKRTAAANPTIASIDDFDFSDVAPIPDSFVLGIRSATSAPDSVQLSVEGETLNIAGRASAAWVRRLRAFIDTTPYLNRVVFDRFVVTERLELESLVQSLAGFTVVFSQGVEIDPVSRDALKTLGDKLERLLKIDRDLEDIDLEFAVKGHTDEVGTFAQNKKIRAQRATVITSLLAAYGVALSHINVKDDFPGIEGALADIRAASLDIHILSSTPPL